MSTLFLSRSLSSMSALSAWAEERELEVIARSLLSFSSVPFVAPNDADWWFFYSSRAVEFSVASLQELAATPKLAAMGSST
ncbi:MAG: hypothetical protein AAGA31_11430, partial [Bacteroidota bacterium]